MEEKKSDVFFPTEIALLKSRFPLSFRIDLPDLGEIGESHDEYDLIPDGHEESKLFAPLYKAVAEKCGAYFLDAAQYASPSEIDSEHMTPEGHAAFGRAIAEKIKEILE